MIFAKSSCTIADSLAGCLIPPPPWEAAIVAIHDRAISLLHPDGALVSVVRGETNIEARAFALDDGPFSRLRVVARDAEGKSMASFGSDYALEIAGARVGTRPERWDPRPALAEAAARFALSGGFASKTGRAALASARKAVTESLAPESPFRSGLFAPSFKALLERELSGGAVPWGIAGFGPGTTPSGDDFIAGFLLARALEGTPPAGMAPQAALEGTTAAGRSLIIQAAAGAFPAHLSSFAVAFGSGGEADAGAVLSHGATSGSDALAGFLAGAGGISEATALFAGTAG